MRLFGKDRRALIEEELRGHVFGKSIVGSLVGLREFTDQERHILLGIFSDLAVQFEIRYMAGLVLAQLKSSGLVEPLESQLRSVAQAENDDGTSPYWFLCQAVRLLDSPRCTEVLKTWLASQFPHVRIEAAYTLCLLGNHDPIKVLFDESHNFGSHGEWKNWKNRIAASRYAGEVANANDLEGLLAALAKGAYGAIADAIIRLGSQSAVPRLLSIAQDTQNLGDLYAAFVLCRLGHATGLSATTMALKHPERFDYLGGRIFEWASEALAAMPETEGFDVLFSFIAQATELLKITGQLPETHFEKLERVINKLKEQRNDLLRKSLRELDPLLGKLKEQMPRHMRSRICRVQDQICWAREKDIEDSQ